MIGVGVAYDVVVGSRGCGAQRGSVARHLIMGDALRVLDDAAQTDTVTVDLRPTLSSTAIGVSYNTAFFCNNGAAYRYRIGVGGFHINAET